MRPRVVVLGGGMAGLVAAWELSRGDWRSEIDSITVYQRGWRLGGKGASSRGPHGRIEEHGLHVLLGYYDATFRVLREVYAELDRATTDPSCPIQTWRDAFVPASDVGLADRNGTAWSHFVTRFSTNDLIPGEPGAEDRAVTPVDVVTRGVALLVDFERAVAAPTAPSRPYLSASPRPRPGPSGVRPLVRGAGLTAMAALLAVVTQASRPLGPDVGRTVADALATVLRPWHDGLHAAVVADPAGRRIWPLIDLVVTNLRGMAVDGLLSGRGFDAIDHLDYRDWLASHGAAQETLESPIVRGMYDLTFAYEGGDRSRPRFAAGLGLQLAQRMLFDYKGSIFWRMQAGMGEVVFAPLYEALRRRGVEFRFFHRLDRLELTGERTVGAIELTRQVELAPGRRTYDPLVSHAGLPCWPDRPIADQLATPAPPGLESHSGPGHGSGVERLVAGRDFDGVVLAVSLGMVPHVAAELVAADERWRLMVEEVATVATRAGQLWFAVREDELGWTGPTGVTLTGFGDVFDTWASMSHLLPREEWPAEGAPKSLAYLCGAMPDADPATASELVQQELERFLEHEAVALWPGSTDGSGFRWDLLWDESGRPGPARLRAQYVRANVDPSDRYVQSLPGSGRHRLAPGRSGFDNLALAGDWTACGLDAGCVEAAVRSGVLAARAVRSGAVGPKERATVRGVPT